MNASASPADRYAVLGHPVAHSQSPLIHAAFAAQTGEAVQYERLLCPLEDFASSIRAFADSGAKGCNVTVPFKFEAARLARSLTPRAQLAGAVNTVRFDSAGWWADNTDGIGLMRDIETNADRPLRGLSVVLLGAGGASAGVLGSLIATRPARILLANRSADKAQALVARHLSWADHHGVALQALSMAELDAAAHRRSVDVLINSTSASLGGAGPLLNEPLLRAGGLGVDLMYGAAAAPFLAEVAAQGAVGRDGLGMLVEQAAEAFAAWRGVRPDTAPVLRMMRDQLLGH